MMKTVKTLVLFCAVFIFGCAGPPPERAPVETVAVTDDLGRVVEVPRRPERIVSTSPEATEILFAVGAGENVVGVTTWCNYPPEARELSKVGDFSNVDMEKVAALEPDVVIATGHEQRRTVENLERLGIPVVVFLAPDVNGVRENIRVIGDITGREEGAAEVLADFDERLAVVDGAVAEIPDRERVSVFVEISNEPLMTVSGGSFVADMIKRAGGVNIGEKLPRAYSRIDPEEVVRRNPDVIVLASGTEPEDAASRVGWSNVTAVRENRVYAGFDEDLLFRAGPRAAEGVEMLYEMFYGDYENP
jgi:iron complex transport system substrate-binding protein